MAITIKHEPQGTFLPAHNPIEWVVLSDNITEENFKYVFDIYLEGSASPDLRLKTPQRPDGYGHINVSSVIRNYISHDIAIDDSQFMRNSNSHQRFKIRFGEQYGASSGTIYPNLTDSDEVVAFNSVFSFRDWLSYDEDKYLIATSGSCFLTNAGTQYFTDDDVGDLYFIVNVSNAAKYVIIKTYREDGTLIQTAQSVNPFASISDDDDRFLRVPCFPVNINLLTLSSGSQPVITSDVYRYTVQIADSSLNATSEEKTFVRRDLCGDTFRLLWVNSLGGVDAYTFNSFRTVINDVERESYTRKRGTINGSGVIVYDTAEAGVRHTAVSNVEKWTLRSGILTEEESDFLKGIVLSPAVYIVADGYLVPVTVQDTSYQTRRYHTDRAFSVEFTIIFERETMNA